MGSQAFEFLCDEYAFVDFDTSLKPVSHVGFYDYRHIVSGRFHHISHAHAHKSHAVVERASVFVTSPVGVRGQELADEITVSGMDFYCVESGITCCIDGSAKGFCDFLDFVFTHSSHKCGGIEVESGRCRYGNLAGCAAVRHIAAMSKLNGGFGSLVVNGICNASQRFDDFGSHP